MKKAVVLLSGGLDSATALYLAKSQGYEIEALSFVYGQKHDKELQCARKIAQAAGVLSHRVVELNLAQWGGSSLTDTALDIPEGDDRSTEIPNTYVPARNMVFLSVAASLAEASGARSIFLGVSQVDYSGYVDCRESFVQAMENAINAGTVCAVEHNDPIHIHAPFLHKTKAEEIQLGIELGVPFQYTWSCYQGGKVPCGSCDSCLLRAKAFAEAGYEDPALYKVEG